MNLFLFITNLAILALIAGLMAVTPMLNRKSLLFGVRVPEGAADTPEGRGLKRSYVAIAALGSLAVFGLATLQYAAAPELTLLAVCYFPFLMIGVQLAAFVPQWKKARGYKEQKGWSVPLTAAVETRSSADREKLSNLPWWWYIASAALILGVAGLSLALYPRLPEQIILHWGMDMQPDQWEPKSVSKLMHMPLIALGTVAILLGSNVLVYRQKLQISAEHPALSFAQHRIYRRMLSNALGFMTLCMSLMFAAIQLGSLNILSTRAPFVPAAIIAACVFGMLPALYVPIRAGQSGCRLKPRVSAEEARGELLAAREKVKAAHPAQGDDQYWKLGMFYYNPEDPAVLVENRFGGNSGFNYARLPAKLFVAAGALLLAASYVVITYMALKYPFV
ncbi:MAG: DUF1648 domain-containing protein [Oscillospiraceae bacterium]|nr:DUF1648 domain-containing protein [Oscillospiraceae bacterium]